MATSIGFATQADGNLYELFDDGSKVLKEAGYQKRIDSIVSSQASAPSAPVSTISASPSSPQIVATAYSSINKSPVKTAGPERIIFDDDAVPIETMTALIFENIGGQELINIARRDTINGQQISYQPIKNMSDIEQRYNPNNLVSLQATSDKYFANFPIQLKDKIPNAGTGTNQTYVYLITSTNDLVIEVINLAADEQIEVQIATDGTIYEAVL
jgi:hypothetical protein